MPGKLKVRVLCARHLPVMDRSSENTDAFAEVKWGETTYKTDVYRKSLNPKWNSDWFRFDASDDAQLQDEPLQVNTSINKL
jgi:Ca2+-dependent lipid-binding protein